MCYARYAFWPIWCVPVSIYAALPQVALVYQVPLFPKVLPPSLYLVHSLLRLILTWKSTTGVGPIVLLVRLPLLDYLRPGPHRLPGSTRDCSTLVERPEDVDDPGGHVQPLRRHPVLSAEDGLLWFWVQRDQQGDGRRADKEIRRRLLWLWGRIALLRVAGDDRGDQPRLFGGGSRSESEPRQPPRHVPTGAHLRLRGGQLLANLRGLGAESGQGEDAGDGYPILGVPSWGSVLRSVLRILDGLSRRLLR